jgi:transposase-like protein
MYCTPKVRHKTFGVFFMKYSYEQRLIIVSRVKQGELIAHLSKEYHINKTQILAWVRMWDKYGRSGLEQQPHCRPTVKLKEEVVRLILEKGVPLSHDNRTQNEPSFLTSITSQEDNPTLVRRWFAPIQKCLGLLCLD